MPFSLPLAEMKGVVPRVFNGCCCETPSGVNSCVAVKRPREAEVKRRTTPGALVEVGVTPRYMDPLKYAEVPNISYELTPSLVSPLESLGPPTYHVFPLGREFPRASLSVQEVG